MPRPPLLLALLAPVFGAACAPAAPTPETIERPRLALSVAELDLGEVAEDTVAQGTVVLTNEGGMPMGVGPIHIGDETAGWSLESDPAAPEDTGTEDTETGIVVPPRDTGGPPEPTGGVWFVLAPQATATVTVSFTGQPFTGPYDEALIIETQTSDEDVPEGELPAYLADPLHRASGVWLDASSVGGETGVLVASSTSQDFGFVYPGVTADPGEITLSNVGAGSLTLDAISLNEACDAQFSLTSAPADGTVLEAGDTATITTMFSPIALDAAYCMVDVSASTGLLSLYLTGNLASAPNAPPTVTVLAPASGIEHTTDVALDVDLLLWDDDQPASSLSCRIESVIAGGRADCTPPDDTGAVSVALPASFFAAGSDTVRVTVTDVRGISAVETFSVVVDAARPADDADGDGYSASGSPADCDDGEAATYPEATERDDGADNDCDGIVDEGTGGFDNDGDGLSGDAGDCDDTTSDTNPDAPERGDGLDNDCDGVVDEGTAQFDDDGDGYSEVQNDCDDTEAAINPAAVELCDGDDNDCDGYRDESGCDGPSAYAVIVGSFIGREQDAVEEQETLALEARVIGGTAEPIEYSWSTDGDGTFDDQKVRVVQFHAPLLVRGGPPLLCLPWQKCRTPIGRYENVYIVALDADGHQDWAFDRIAVWALRAHLYDPYTVPVEASDAGDPGGCGSGGCDTGGTGAGLWGAALAWVAGLRRRR